MSYQQPYGCRYAGELTPAGTIPPDAMERIKAQGYNLIEISPAPGVCFVVRVDEADATLAWIFGTKL